MEFAETKKLVLSTAEQISTSAEKIKSEFIGEKSVDSFLKFRIVIENPRVIFPRSEDEISEILIADLGQIVMSNSYTSASTENIILEKVPRFIFGC